VLAYGGANLSVEAIDQVEQATLAEREIGQRMERAFDLPHQRLGADRQHVDRLSHSVPSPQDRSAIEVTSSPVGKRFPKAV
jgi:hypothetical protein